MENNNKISRTIEGINSTLESGAQALTVDLTVNSPQTSSAQASGCAAPPGSSSTQVTFGEVGAPTAQSPDRGRESDTNPRQTLPNFSPHTFPHTVKPHTSPHTFITPTQFPKSSPVDIFTMKKNLLYVDRALKKIIPSKKSQSYYSGLQDLLSYLKDNKILEEDENFPSLDENTDHKVDILKLTPAQQAERSNKQAYIVSKIVLGCNILILIAKIVACIITRSMSLTTSTIDSAVDIVSSFITYLTNYKIKNLNIYKHPQGKTRMLPLSIIIISVIMTITNFQIIIESFQMIVGGDKDNLKDPIYGHVVAGATVVIKIALFFLCYRVKSPTTQVLAQDSRNDVLSNLAVLTGLLISQHLWLYGDCVAAIIISAFLVYNWGSTAISHLGLLIGKTASALSLQAYGWVVLTHDPENILFVDTVRAYAFGNRYLLEVDIGLQEDMKLNKAHDIGESLQQKLEALPDIERAFVHLDYEKNHKPDFEHKLGKLF